jgi:hypothetical protein
LEQLELFKIFLTSSLTIIGGVTIFVIGQIILRFIIEPILELNKLRGEIAFSLIFYANVYINPPANLVFPEDRKLLDNIQEVLRKLASQLCPRASVIPLFKIWELLKIVPNFDNFAAATTELIGLSNSIHEPNVDFNKIRREKIKKLLNIK